jgi:hypothetical protein
MSLNLTLDSCSVKLRVFCCFAMDPRVLDLPSLYFDSYAPGCLLELDSNRGFTFLAPVMAR